MRIRTTWLLAAFAALFIGTSCFGQPVAAATVERGPYLQIATPTGIVLRWRTEGADPATTSVVNYGTTLGALGSSADAAPQQAVVLGTGNVDRTVTEHEVALTGLAPNTRYYYDVGDESGVNAGGDATYSFVTPPIIGTAQATRIWAIGDSGTANSDAMAVRDAYKAKVAAEGRPTDLWLMLGDNAYNDGKDYQYQAAVFDMYPEILRQAPVWPTRGNHDKAFVTPNDGPIAAYYDIFTLPTAGEAGGLSSGTEAYYSFDHANIHFIVLDSFGSSNAPGSAMLSWLENDLMSTSQDWVIAYWHHPPYTKGSHNSDTESRLIEMRENALPILEEYGVDLVLGGHSHSYERSFLLTGHYDVSGTLAPSMVLDNGDGREGGDGAYFKDGSAPLANDGAVYTVAGSSGKATGSGSLNHPAMFYSIKNLGSVVLDIDGNRLDAVFISQTGAVLDSFTMINGGTGFESGFSGIASATVSDGTPKLLDVPTFAVSVSAKGKNWSGSTTVTVLDQDGLPTAGATVTGQWTHEQPAGGGSSNLNRVVATTNSEGQFATTSSKLRASSGDGFRFTVSTVSRGNDTLDPARSTLTDIAVVP